MSSREGHLQVENKNALNKKKRSPFKVNWWGIPPTTLLHGRCNLKALATSTTDLSTRTWIFNFETISQREIFQNTRKIIRSARKLIFCHSSAWYPFLEPITKCSEFELKKMLALCIFTDWKDSGKNDCSTLWNKNPTGYLLRHWQKT